MDDLVSWISAGAGVAAVGVAVVFTLRQEQATKAAEKKRSAAEAERSDSERQRLTAEKDRLAAETTRLEAEQARFAAEQERADQESLRQARDRVLSIGVGIEVEQAPSEEILAQLPRERHGWRYLVFHNGTGQAVRDVRATVHYNDAEDVVVEQKLIEGGHPRLRLQTLPPYQPSAGLDLRFTDGQGNHWHRDGEGVLTLIDT